MDKKQIEQLIKEGRDFMKMPIEDPDYRSDQDLKLPQPPLFKSAMREEAIDLPVNFDALSIENNFLKIMNIRKSDRLYTNEPMSLLSLSYLLWCSQGVKEIRGQNYATIRTVPCGGARHQFETYMAVQNVEHLQDGLYHYLPQTHQIELLKTQVDLKSFIGNALGGQDWANKANINFFYSVVAYRCEWRYGIYAHRVALMDVGHISENLYLAATSIQCGVCGVGYINETILNEAFELDGVEEYMIYAMPVGTIKTESLAKKDPYQFIKKG